MSAGTIRYGTPAGRWVGVDFTDGFRRATWISAAICALGGLTAWVTIRGEGHNVNHVPLCPEQPPEPVRV